MKAIYVIVALVLIVVAAGGGFYAGTVYAQGQTQNSVNNFIQQRTANGQNGGTGQQAAALGPCGFPQRNGGNFGGRQGGQGTQGGQSAQGGQTGGTQDRQTGQGGQGSQFQQFGNCVARGEIKSIDLQAGTMEITTPVNVVTVKLATGQTVVSKTDVGALTDLKTGDRVTVFSRESGDSPTASVVQLQGGPGQVGQ